MADNTKVEWRAAAWVDTDGKTEYWYVVDDSDDPQPVAICPRGKKIAEEICLDRLKVADIIDEIKKRIAVTNTLPEQQRALKQLLQWLTEGE